LISRTGFAPLLHFQDTPGPVARSVRDLAKLLDVLVGYDAADPYTGAVALAADAGHYEALLDGARIDGVRIGVLEDGFGSDDPSSTDVSAVVHRLLERLSEAGAQTVDVRIPSLQDWIARTSLYVQQSKADLNRFMAGRAGAPAQSFEQIYANGWFHPLNDLFHALAAGPSEPEPAAYYPQRLAQIEFQRL
jgi:amidase